MAVTEHVGLLTLVDESGNQQILYPGTRGDCVIGLEDTVRGLAYTKEDTLSDATKELLGGISTPDEAFETLRAIVAAGKRLVSVTVKTEDGKPVEGAVITGLSPVSGEQVVTAANGKAIGFVDAESATIKTSNLIDLTSGSVTVSAPADTITSAVMTLGYVNFMAFTSSKTVQLSKLCTRLDVSAVGGGGGGARSTGDNLTGGGGGGNVVVEESVPFTPCSDIPVTVGAGGVRGYWNTSTSSHVSSTDGGDSSMLSVKATGGGKGLDLYRDTSTGGASSTSPGGNYAQDGSDSTATIFSSFTGTKLVSGGGGGCGATPSSSVTGGGNMTNGGSPYGGKGGKSYSENLGGTTNAISNCSGTSATGPGGGGGAAGSYKANPYAYGNGGNGYRGEVAIRMWHGEEAS